MKTRIALLATSVIASLAMSACGSGGLFGPALTPTPIPLSDAEFADAARSACSTLQTESASLTDLDLTSRATAYQKAADALAALNITAESAPQGTKMRSGLADLADSFGEFGKAIIDATSRTNLQDPVTIAITEDGSVFAYPGDNLFEMTKLDVDPALLSGIRAYQVQVQEAATSLKLEECVVKW